MMPVNKVKIGILCSEGGRELAALIGALTEGHLPAAIALVVADRDSEALNLARAAGLYGAFLPRSAYHANRDGFERRLVEMLTQAEVSLVALAGYEREAGPVLAEAFPGRLFGQGLGPAELLMELAGRVRQRLFTVLENPAP